MRTLAAALLALVTAAHAAEPAKTYNHVRLIDGTGAPARNDMAIMVQGERIATIAHAVAPGKNIIDMHGAIAMPGMINTHVHLATLAQPAHAWRRSSGAISMPASPRCATWPATRANSAFLRAMHASAISPRPTSIMRV